jgi:BolA family transcriptional regulator, general stress-responsive regulator
VNLGAEIHARLASLEPESIDLVDESGEHVGHEGSRNGGSHFNLVIVSPRFTGKTTIARHRMVYDALGDLMQREVHALAIRALAPDEL